MATYYLTMVQPLSQKLSEIAKLLDLPRPSLVVVVGAGISIDATAQPQASWLGLLKHGIRYLVQKRFQQEWGNELEASLEAAFSPFDLEAALRHAELVERALNTPDAKAFAEWLQFAFYNFKVRDGHTAALEALRDLQQAGALLLSTNYDSLLTEITGLRPVTWEEHDQFLKVVTRKESGILHIHGHWQQPSSIVLGRSSYERVMADQRIQDLLKTLWLDWNWLYVGCGDGLHDPNLWRLLHWSKYWGTGALPDYFLARDDRATEIEKRADKPQNLFSIGYPSYSDLPGVLRSISPAARCWPFVQIDQDFPLFRIPGSDIPFPSRQEYLDGEVPILDADAEVRERLGTHGWACVLDLASVGKTTLALRLATAREQSEHQVFYFDLKNEILDFDEGGPAAALQRLARPGILLILDNIHHQPEVARYLWQQWKANPHGSRLLLIATKMQRQVVISPEQDLTFFEAHPTNPAIILSPSPEDLGRIAKHIYRRVSGVLALPMPDPPKEVLTSWHRDFRAALNAFTFAVMSRLADFAKMRWDLPPSAASAWVREKWLKQLDDREIENAICLAAFGAQELEMLVPEHALPYPGRTEGMVKLGLVVRTKAGRFRQYSRFSLREPGWGRLILAALESPRDIEPILFGAAVRHPIVAVLMNQRLKVEGLAGRERLWTSLDSEKEILASNLFQVDVPLSYVSTLLRESQASSHRQLTSFLWQTIDSQPDKLAVSAWETMLDEVASFLEVARRQGRDTNPLWAVIESQPDRLGARVWETPLDKAGSFLEVAKRQGRDTKPLWAVIESQPDKLAARAWETRLDQVASFLEVAK